MSDCYSTDEELYNYDELAEAVEAAIDNAWQEDIEYPYVVVVYSGKKDPIPAASYYLPDMALALNKNAYDHVGEVAEDWPWEDEGLQRAVAEAVDAWAEKNGQQPDFYNVIDTTKINIEVVGEGRWHAVSPMPVTSDAGDKS